MITLLVFLLILSVLVLIHELGHYLVAKKLNIKVEEFGFGLPPRLWGKKIGETIYSINWLPIGGFVKLYGEDDAGAGRVTKGKEQKPKSKNDEGRAFYARPVWQRAAVVVAGVVMNAALAIIIFYTFLLMSNFKTELPFLTDHNFMLVNQSRKLQSLVVSQVRPDSPASQAGIKPCSKDFCASIDSINGQKIVSTEQFRNTIERNKGKEVTLSWVDGVTNKRYTEMITPRVNPPKDQGALGIAFQAQEAIVLSYDTPGQKVLSGITHPINLMTYQFNLLGKIISYSVREKTAAPLGDAVSGPVGIFVVTGQVLQIEDVKQRILQVLNLAGLLSVSLAFFNILPIPALDGGRLFFILIEGIFRKKVSQRIEAAAHTIGMAVLLALIFLITFKDIFQHIIPNIFK